MPPLNATSSSSATATNIYALSDALTPPETILLLTLSVAFVLAGLFLVMLERGGALKA